VSHVIYLLFSGLIVFVPQRDSSIKAYLVKDVPSLQCDHEPYLAVSGSFKVLEGSACKRIMPTLLVCDLEDTIANLATENGQVSLPPSPAPNEPLPKDIADGGSSKWLIRMADVQASAAKVKPNLAGLFDAEFDFGWSAARTCLFDEEEPPQMNKKVVAINFKDVNGGIFRTQAVAERVMFTSSVSSDNPTLILKKGALATKIELDCSAGSCPVLKFSNNVEQDNCTVSSHFEHYFSFSNTPGSKLGAERFSAKVIDSAAVTAGCAEGGGLLPLMKDVVRAQLRQDIEGLVGPKPSDRLICPPIVMEQ